MTCRTLLIVLLTSCAWRGCLSVMCYWCSGVGNDRECETRPYAVQTGPVYLNCRANFCLSAKVIDAETGQVQSFARLCDNIPRGNLCIRDSKLLTCYESCTTDLCNNGNPSPLHLPTVSYAGESIGPHNYQNGYSPIQTHDTIGRPYKSNSLKGARNIRFGPRRDMWLATRQHDYLATRPRRFPFIVTTPATREHDFRRGMSNSHFLKAGMGKETSSRDMEMMDEKRVVGKAHNTVHEETNLEHSMNQITSNPGMKHSPIPDSMKSTLQGHRERNIKIPVVDRPKPSGDKDILGEFGAGTQKQHRHEEPKDYTATLEESVPSRSHAKSPNDYLATMDLGYGDTSNNAQVSKHEKVKNDLQYIDGDDSEVFYEEEFEVDQFGEVGRGSDGMVIWPRRAIEEEIEREEMRREDEVPVSNLIVEEDREEGLIQTFRANTTKTTKDADKLGVKEGEKNDAKSTVADAMTDSLKVTESQILDQMKGSTKKSTSSVIIAKTTGKKERTTTTQENKVKPIKNLKLTTEKSTTATTADTTLSMTTASTTSTTSTTATTTTTTTTTTTPSTTTSKPATNKKISTPTRKFKLTIPRTQLGTKQTTLPYIWRETSAWEEDVTLTDKADVKTTGSGEKTATTNRPKSKSHHRKVHLTDFLELQSTTEPANNISTKTNFSVTGHHPNQTSLAQKAPVAETEEEEGAIYLDESLTENLLGLKEDLQDETEAELTGSHSPATSSTCFHLLFAAVTTTLYIL